MLPCSTRRSIDKVLPIHTNESSPVTGCSTVADVRLLRCTRGVLSSDSTTFESFEASSVFESRHTRLIVIAVIAVFVVGGLLAYRLTSNRVNVAWGEAVTMHGAPTVHLGGGANLYSLSCASPGNCSAVGSYLVKENHNRAIVVNERRGRWGNVEALTGLTSRDDGLNTGTFAVSCASPGYCSAGGTYSMGRNQLLIFVANERDGVWGRTRAIPGVRALETGYYADLSTISCASPGNCSAGGDVDTANGARAFVLDQVGGSWGVPDLISGVGSYRMAGSRISSISCSAPGDCSAVGTTQKSPPGSSAFTVAETNGVWGGAAAIPGLAALSPGGSAYEVSLSCATVGSCGARGTYRSQTGVTQSFLADETHGVWGRAFDIPGIVALDGHHIEQLNTISCGSPGNCSAGGSYGNGSHERAFLVSEVRGHWGTPTLVAGLASLNQGAFTAVTDISCSSAGTCGVVGSYSGTGGYVQTFALNEVRGAWGAATEIGASSVPGAIGAQATAISCNSPRGCAVVGVAFKSMLGGALFAQSTRATS